LLGWIKFLWGIVSQVEGFGPKIKALARLIRLVKG